MEDAVFINARAAKKAMGSHKWFPGRQIIMRPVYERRALKGYRVLVNGIALNENQAEAMT